MKKKRLFKVWFSLGRMERFLSKRYPEGHWYTENIIDLVVEGTFDLKLSGNDDQWLIRLRKGWDRTAIVKRSLELSLARDAVHRLGGHTNTIAWADKLRETWLCRMNAKNHASSH